MADFLAEQLAPDDLGHASAASGSVPAEELFFPGTDNAIILYYEMRGIDSGAAYTTWVATGAPDPNGVQATALNTTPALVGAIVAGSGIVLLAW